MITIRNRNDGKVYQDGTPKKPNYEYRFETAKINGKRTCITKAGFRTKKECEAAGLKAYNEYKYGLTSKPSEISFADLFEEWLKNYVLINARETTYDKYKKTADRYILDKIGRYKATSITTHILQSLINELSIDLYKSTLTLIRSILYGSFEYARKMLRIIVINPCKDVIVPKKATQRKDLSILSKEDVKRIFERITKPKYYYPMLTAYYTGMRASEVYGLTWDKIDLENQIITIDQIVKQVKYGEWYLGDPKTRTSKREIVIGDTLTNALKEYKAMQEQNIAALGKDYKFTYGKKDKSKAGEDIIKLSHDKIGDRIDLVFTHPDGTYNGTKDLSTLSTVVKNKVGIDFHFHSLRHTHATMLIESGAPIKSVSERLGHKDTTVTIETYVHNTQTMINETVDIFEQCGNLNDNIVKFGRQMVDKNTKKA